MIENLEAGAREAVAYAAAHSALVGIAIAAIVAAILAGLNARYWHHAADDWEAIADTWHGVADAEQELTALEREQHRRTREQLRELRLAVGSRERIAARIGQPFPYDEGSWAVALADLTDDYDKRLRAVVETALAPHREISPSARITHVRSESFAARPAGDAYHDSTRMDHMNRVIRESAAAAEAATSHPGDYASGAGQVVS